MNQETANKLVAIAVMKKRIAELEAEVKADAIEGMDRGDRKTAYAGGHRIGSVTKADPKGAWKVTDGEAWREWVKENHPDEIVTVEAVNAAFEKAILARCESTGELVPGIDWREGSPYLTVKPDPDAATAIAAELESEGVTFAAWLDSLARKEIQA